MKQAKKFLALLAAAALAMTLLAGCTVRPGPDGNVIIVPDDEEEYIPAPPVVTMPEDVGTIVEESEKQLNGYHETTYKSVYEKTKQEATSEEFYMTATLKQGDEGDVQIQWAVYKDSRYAKIITPWTGTTETLFVNGNIYNKDPETNQWGCVESSDQMEDMFEYLFHDLSDSNAQWYSATTSNGFNVDYTDPLVQGEEDKVMYTTYCWNGKLARVDTKMLGASNEITMVTTTTCHTQTTLPASVEALLKNPPIAPITPITPVN